jgi:two-component system, chemotaxis family, CheB/CheR fusion protein
MYLGKAETVRPVQAFYELVNKQWKVYRCIANALPLGQRQHFSDMNTPQLERHSMKRPNRSLSKPDVEQKPSASSLEISQLRRFNEVLLRFLAVGVVVIDRSYRIVTANGAARRLLGLREVGIDQDFLHTARGVPYHQVRVAIDTVFRERSPINLEEVELESMTGENGRYVNLSLALVQIETGLPDLAIISVTDVTQQVQVRQQLETAQAEQRKLMNDLGTANKHLTDMNKELTETNEGLQVANEELVLTHEELQASIEEFETTNEELLVYQCKAYQETVERLLSTVESINRVMTRELLNSEIPHAEVVLSKMLGSLNNRFIRGSSRGGASSASMKASHCSAFKPKCRLSVKVSSARASALSSTKSLTERCATAAAL